MSVQLRHRNAAVLHRRTAAAPCVLARLAPATRTTPLDESLALPMHVLFSPPSQPACVTCEIKHRDCLGHGDTCEVNVAFVARRGRRTAACATPVHPRVDGLRPEHQPVRRRAGRRVRRHGGAVLRPRAVRRAGLAVSRQGDEEPAPVERGAVPAALRGAPELRLLLVRIRADRRHERDVRARVLPQGGLRRLHGRRPDGRLRRVDQRRPWVGRPLGPRGVPRRPEGGA